jgi:tRNA threonylcarbamoyladenosine biosynthesis protein TsaB
MRILGICTVGDVCEAACLDTATGQSALASEAMKTGHDARIAALVAEAAEKAGLKLADMDRIAVVTGPGSFTGVRVGVALARGLALAIDKPAAGVTTLEAMAGETLTGPVLALLPARRRPPALSWWAQIIGPDGRGQGEPVEAGSDEVRAIAAGAAAVVGQDFDMLGLDLSRRASAPSALNACRYISRLPTDALPPASPIYVREPDAAPMARPPTVLS